MRRNTPLSAMSEKRRRLNDARREAMVLAFGPPSGWRCQFVAYVEAAHAQDQISDADYARLKHHRCFGLVNGHELKKRSQGGSITDPANVVLLCSQANSWVEDEPALAHALGLVRRRGDD